MYFNSSLGLQQVKGVWLGRLHCHACRCVQYALQFYFPARAKMRCRPTGVKSDRSRTAAVQKHDVSHKALGAIDTARVRRIQGGNRDTLDACQVVVLGVAWIYRSGPTKLPLPSSIFVLRSRAGWAATQIEWLRNATFTEPRTGTSPYARE